MGMDVFGTAPVSERGKYFRNNVWWWHPLWDYCERLAPDIIPSDNLGHSNDGWGLNSRAALILADRLATALASGKTEQYAQHYAAYLESLPDEPCAVCGATGTRTAPPAVGAGMQPCYCCNGTGHTPSFEKHYPFSVDNVREFEAFLRESGGFNIH